jgi:hypothetical protein
MDGEQHRIKRKSVPSTLGPLTPSAQGVHSRRSYERVNSDFVSEPYEPYRGGEGDQNSSYHLAGLDEHSNSYPLTDVPFEENPKQAQSHVNHHQGGSHPYAPPLGGEPTQRRRRCWEVLDIWKWEIICCVLAVAALMAVFGTLYPYDGHPLPQWPYGISINSLISIYVLIMKASMSLILAQGE